MYRIQPFGSRTALAVTTALVMAAGYSCTQEQQPEPGPLAEHVVTVVAPGRVILPRHVRVTGTLFGEEETNIAAKVPGRIAEVVKDLGDAALPGETLLRIDPTDYELVLTERRLALAESLARLGLREVPPQDFDVATLPWVERARLQAANAKDKLDRGQALFEREPPSISEQEYADRQTAWEVAQTNLVAARLEAEATLAVARTLSAQANIAAQRLKDATIRAPEFPPAQSAQPPRYAVSQRLVAVGDYVETGDTLLRLVDADPVKLIVQVIERSQGEVKLGQPVLVRVEAFEQEFRGTVSRISPSVDSATRTFPVEIIIPNPDRLLKPGSFAHAQIQTRREEAWMVPESCVTTFAGVNKLILVREGTALELRVDLGERNGGMIEIRADLSEQDQVVLTPSTSLYTGAPVRIDDAPAGVSQ